MWIRDKPRVKDKSGYKTEYITVLYRLHNYKKGDRHTHWLCVCKCGNFIELATNNINIIVKGEKMTLKQACEKYNKNYTSEVKRYHRMLDNYEFIC